MATTCFVCCEESEYWTLPPCNHTHICWKCCLKLVDGSIFSCPFCKDKPEAKSQLLFVTTEQMLQKEFQTIMQHNPYRSNKNTYYFYSNKKVAQYIEAETSYHCILCGQVHQTMNLLKKHLYGHRVQFCDVCLQNRKCMIPQQKLYTDYQLQIHLKQGETSATGEIALYHPHCEFCARRFYDLQAFKIHLKMSAHLKCQICDLNCPKLKYVYYKNFQQLERHHRKSHFVCDLGECITRKLQNVFASQNLLEQHKRRFHRKYRGDKNEKLDNIILGFNKKQEEDLLQFDGIGRDLSHQFTVFQLQGPVQKQQHNDELIDLRQFYPQIVKANHNPRIQEIINRTLQLQDRKQLNFSHLPLYKPLEMSSLSRDQCYRLIRKVCSPKQTDSIFELFFTKKNDFKSVQEYIQAIQRKMCSYNPALFFMVFPQLIRNLKPQNKNKVLMDQLYSSRLRILPVNRFFIFHEYQRYSALIEITKSTVQEQISFRLNEGEIDLQVYAKFLKQMNANYYVQKHDQIYWVSKQKMTHLYHMIQRCKTKDFLKMNWLLKVGLSNTSYNLLHKFYYSTTKEIEQANRFLRPLSLQQLSLLNAYLMLCLQSLLDIQSFEQSKKNPKPHYLTNIILQIPQSKRLPLRQLEQLRTLEGHSDAIIKKTYERRGKGIYIHQNDCPSLLAPVDCNEVFTKPKQQKPQIMLGKGNLPTPWNEDRAKLKKQPTKERTKNQQQFPTLGHFGETIGNTNKQVKQQAKNIKQEQEDFPIFNFKQKYITHKLPVNQETVNNWVNFNNKSINRSAWDQDQTRKKWKDIQTQKKEEKKFQNNNQMKTAQMGKSSMDSPGNKKRNKQRYKLNNYDDQDDKYLRMAIEESLHTAKQEGLRRKEENIKKQQQTYQIIVPKKNNKIQEQQSPKIKKKKRGGDKKQQQQPVVLKTEKQLKQQLSLFERIQLQEKQAQNRKRSPFRRDKSYQKKQKSLSSIAPQNDKKILSNTKGPIFDDDDFIPIGQITSVPKQSIITRIIKQNQSKQEIEEVRPQKQRHKKKKNRGQQYD